MSWTEKTGYTEADLSPNYLEYHKARELLEDLIGAPVAPAPKAARDRASLLAWWRAQEKYWRGWSDVTTLCIREMRKLMRGSR